MPTQPQFYKGDAKELQYFNSANPTILNLETGKDEFFEDAYNCFKLGEILYDSGRAPLANAIPRDIFREAFTAIFGSFLEAGSFETYLEVFRNIFGEDVEVTFTVPAPGKLEIDIVAAGLAIFDLIGRSIQDDTYVIDEIVDYDGNNVVGQSVKGFETQYELEQMLFEMVPSGIYTQITLTVGS